MKTESLGDKTLVMIVGPSAIGKSTLMNEMVRLDDDFAYVRSFKTRAPRPGEQSNYDFIDRQAAEDLLSTGQAVTYFEHPTTHDIYGTTGDSYPGRFNLLDTLSGSVDGYRKLPFADTVTISLTAPVDEWRQWFIDRYPTASPEAEKRLAEAALSITWSLEDDQVHWITNTAGNITETAAAAISLTLDPPAVPSIPEEPRAMLELIQGGIW